MLLGLRTTIYPAPALDAAKAWWTARLGGDPYFDQPFYVGFDVGGYELGLDPNAPVEDGAVAYWGVVDCAAALRELREAGATARTDVQEVGEGIRVATVRDAAGSVVGVIENPHFAARS